MTQVWRSVESISVAGVASALIGLSDGNQAFPPAFESKIMRIITFTVILCCTVPYRRTPCGICTFWLMPSSTAERSESNHLYAIVSVSHGSFVYNSSQCF